MNKYLVVFEKADHNYSAYSPDLPGCVATGTNRKQVEKNIKETIEFHIDGMKEEGQKPPKSTSFTDFVEV